MLKTSRRQFERTSVDIAVSYSIEGAGVSETARAIDLSGGGVRISSVKQLAQGAHIVLDFHLPKTEGAIVAHGRLVMSFFDGKSKEYSHGVAFTQIAQTHQEAIVEFIRQTGRAQL